MPYKLENTGEIIESINEKIRTADTLIEHLKKSQNEYESVVKNQSDLGQKIESLVNRQKEINDHIENIFKQHEDMIHDMNDTITHQFENYEKLQKENLVEVIGLVKSIQENTIESVNQIEQMMKIHCDEKQKEVTQQLSLIEQKIVNQLLQIQVSFNQKFTELIDKTEKTKEEIYFIEQKTSKSLKSTREMMVYLFLITFLGIVVLIYLHFFPFV